MLTFKLYDKRFSFICCHLKAGANKGGKRSDMMAKILKGLGTDIEIDATSDFTFILGDLNYRFLSTYTAHIKQVKD